MVSLREVSRAQPEIGGTFEIARTRIIEISIKLLAQEGPD